MCRVKYIIPNHQQKLLYGKINFMSIKTIKNKYKTIGKATVSEGESQSKTALAIQKLAKSQARTISLRGGLEILGFTNIEFFPKTYRYRDGFAERDGKLYYFSRNTNEDCVSGKYMTVMHREARDRKDYGGSHSINQWTLDRELEKKYGLRFSEPRCRQDYNDLEDYELALQEERKNQYEVKTYTDDVDDIDYDTIVEKLLKKKEKLSSKQKATKTVTI